jgi:hypothetical protein
MPQHLGQQPSLQHERQYARICANSVCEGLFHKAIALLIFTTFLPMNTRDRPQSLPVPQRKHRKRLMSDHPQATRQDARPCLLIERP